MFNISVIIPTFNRQKSLIRALDSVYKQSYQPSEIIVIDDGSTDQTANIVYKNYPDVTYVYQENAGVSMARNTGILQSTGDWIALLDSDDEWHKNKLLQQTTLLDKNPSYSIIHTDEIWIRNGIRVNPKNKHQKIGGHIFQECLPLCVISPSSVIIHKLIFQDIGLFNHLFPACEDYDLWLRICSKYPVLYVDKKLVTKYGGHIDQLSKKHWGMDRFRIKALENILQNGQLENDDLHQTILTMHEKIRVFQNGAHKRNDYSSDKKYELLCSQFPIKLLDSIT
jgi:glycosyltransferase involved in cell wall biosynthesis